MYTAQFVAAALLLSVGLTTASPRSIFLSPFKEQYFEGLGTRAPGQLSGSKRPLILAEPNNKELYGIIMAAVRDALRNQQIGGDGVVADDAASLVEQPAKRHRFQNHFDVLAGGGLGRR